MGKGHLLASMTIRKHVPRGLEHSGFELGFVVNTPKLKKELFQQV